MISVTTDSIPPRDRAEFWADFVSRHVRPMRIEPAGEGALRGAIEGRPLGDIRVARVSGAGINALHTRAQIARGDGQLYGACVSLEGEARITRNSETIAVGPGDIFITDGRQEYALDLVRPWRHLVIMVPTGWLDSRVARPERLGGAVLSAHPLGRLWSSHLATGFALADELSPDAAMLFARHSLDLLVQLLDEAHRDGRTAAETVRAAVFVAADRVITRRFGEPNLTPARIARDIGVSSRTLERAFAAHGETVMRRVFNERLSQAARHLRSPASAHRSITDIAFACGFSDSSHFGRLFFRKMQVTPSQWRRQA
jgi:AraC family transcriptional regulator, positive regulator of tynA and feaB